MSPPAEFERKCEICKRSNFNGRMLGPLIHTDSISAHFNCVLYSPVTPDAESIAVRPEDKAIAGVSTRFIRDEGRRAQRLVIKKKSMIFNFVMSAVCSYFSYRRAIFVKQKVLMSDAAMTLELIQCWNFVQRNITLIVVWTLERHSALATIVERCHFVSIIAINSKGMKNNQSKRISAGI